MKKSIKFFHWAPRILCVLAILFVGMFSLDSFDPKLTLGDQLLGFLIHNIPTLVLIAILIVSWKWELIGGFIFILIGIVMSPFIFSHNYQMNHSVGMSLMVILMITFPFIVVGALFVISHFLKRKKVQES